MKRISLVALAMAWTAPAWAEPVPRFNEFLTIMRKHDCSMTWKQAKKVLLADAGFKNSTVQRIVGYALDNGIASLENRSQDDTNGETVVLSEASCKG